MKSNRIFTSTILTLIILLAYTQLIAQAAPRFKSAGHVFYQGQVLLNKHGTNPNFADWNNDGKIDLVVGFHYEGRIQVYQNGGEIFPTFDKEFTTLEADGKLIAFAEYT